MSIFNTEDLSDLPPALIKELRLAGNMDTKLLTLFEEGGGTLDLTTLLVAFYRKHKEVRTRQYMMTTCYRLVKKGFLYQAQGKGHYEITEKGRQVIGVPERLDIEREDKDGTIGDKYEEGA
ncbi:MAG TPA: hypothetical protein DDX54_06965 [Rhodospirillaceae bacterium]|jgi:hypothetical protein|nr:hypothetical protein [Alphaproteobacteria bacterium]HBH27123.1 hypothetical protein [Rhodospirillaceae bacterium]